MIFRATLFIKRPYIFLLTFITFYYVKVGEHTEFMCQKLSKKQLVLSRIFPFSNTVYIFKDKVLCTSSVFKTR